MRVEQNQVIIQDRSQIKGTDKKPEVQSQSPSGPPLNAQEYSSKQKQSLGQSESNQGGGNKGTNLLNRLAALGGVNPIPVLPIDETEFFIDTKKNDLNNHNDRFVHIVGDAIDTDSERHDLNQAMKQAEKKGQKVIFVQGEKENPAYFVATSKDLDGKKPGYITHVESLEKGATESFSLDNLEDKVSPLERLKPFDLTSLKSLDSYQHRQLDAIGAQGEALLKVAKSESLLSVAKNLNPQQIKILASLNQEQLEAFKNIPAPTRAFIDIPPGKNDPAISEQEFQIMNNMSDLTLNALRNLSVGELASLQKLNGMPQEALDILDWEKPQLNAFQKLNPDQLTQLQAIEPDALKSMKALRTRL
jgi:hypothetical protein